MDKHRIKKDLIDIQEIIADEIDHLFKTEEDNYTENRLQGIFDDIQDAIDQFRYIDDPHAFNTEVIERQKKYQSATDKKIDGLEEELMVVRTENESLKMAISRANDTIKEQTGAIRMLKELLKEM